ncbi:MAG: DnaD domain protein [Eubacterium sp.]|nr:DnaD domain protein [Eubacterium sp.]MDE6155709.1 DnaD domain protein [Eubacterium sp.]MDE6767314.1 DnaD domain protein [Eubacterium sp.]
MDYRVMPFGEVWNNGIFNVPNSLVDKYLKMASEYQLKALLFILRNGGQSDSQAIAKALGQTASDIDDLLEFWVEESVIAVDGQAVTIQSKTEIKQIEEPKAKPIRETLSAPRLTPKDIVAFIRDDESIRFLLLQAEQVLGRSISHAEQEMLVNMVNYYGLKAEVILMILEFYRSEKERGKAIGISYVNTMAKNWSEEGIDSIADAELKLQDIARSDRLWNEIVAITGIRHRRPTAKQREMVDEWFKSFDTTMVNLASDIMKENTSEPSLAYINKILKQWKKKGITSPAQVQAEQEAFNRSKEDKKSDKLKSKPSYDLEKIKRDAMDNTEI